MQQRVLESVRDHGEFYPPGTDYTISSRMRTIGHQLVQRGLIGMRPWNHPEVTAGRLPQLFLTPEGQAALNSESLQEGEITMATRKRTTKPTKGVPPSNKFVTTC
jgi:hypothetical protein